MNYFNRATTKFIFLFFCLFTGLLLLGSLGYVLYVIYGIGYGVLDASDVFQGTLETFVGLIFLPSYPLWNMFVTMSDFLALSIATIMYIIPVSILGFCIQLIRNK